MTTKDIFALLTIAVEKMTALDNRRVPRLFKKGLIEHDRRPGAYGYVLTQRGWVYVHRLTKLEI